jgi:hypothetical protein
MFDGRKRHVLRDLNTGLIPAVGNRCWGRCTTGSNGRSVSVHPDEALLAQLRQRQPTQAGQSSANASRSSKPWPTSGTGKADAHDTSAPARTCST